MWGLWKLAEDVMQWVRYWVSVGFLKRTVLSFATGVRRQQYLGIEQCYDRVALVYEYIAAYAIS